MMILRPPVASLASVGVVFKASLIAAFLIISSKTATSPTVDAVDFVRFSRKAGFHRDLVTEVRLHKKDVEINFSECHLVLTEVLPQGLYVDLDQIHSIGNNTLQKVESLEPIDTEKPAHESPNHVIRVHTNIRQVSPGVFSASVILPVHLRYHRPSETRETDHALVHIKHPRMQLECESDIDPDNKEQRNGTPKSKSNFLREVQFKSAADHVEFKVPVGQKCDSVMVATVTLCSTVFGCLYLIYTLLDNKKEHFKKTN
ncbi:phosphatidylinositol-glycan biosynthesis class X protein [Lingula anatina]|uniref:Phosphatidylinositol-glycan biosynthesis class X protein n=1 Tax=Lingula anatina TaxID=7574 RepID=A0A1S3INU1_LINAN|nr:phosphatidylinositol-glycan biosynthesis class X protein [Lingula anatina]|eukprot:XP_013399204.1 phosphatidylinositol-glycan biosynthesis class X protein [Lingula anatina]